MIIAAKKYREEAQRLQAEAEQAKSAEIKRQLLDIARQYDILVNHIEKHHPQLS